MAKGIMYVDNIRVEFDDEPTIMDVCRKAGVEMPNFCFHSDLSVYGACRMCMVEDLDTGKIDAACTTKPKNGMRIRTNTSRLLKYRRMILELMLASHCRDCTACEKNRSCRLQEMAVRFGIHHVHFKDTREHVPMDFSSPAVTFDLNKCILCGDCVRVCKEVQGMSILHFAGRGPGLHIEAGDDQPISTTHCVSCGQCAAVCPTGAITIRNETEKFWSMLQDQTRKVVVQYAPSVRVGMAERFGLPANEPCTGKLVAALRRLGADVVYDTNLTADLTIMEEGSEFIERFTHKDQYQWPMFTSCCPGWVRFVKSQYPELTDNLSTAKSPQQMFGAVAKSYFAEKVGIDPKRLFVVSIMPCVSKKSECALPTMKNDAGDPDVDVSITTRELNIMMRANHIEPKYLPEEEFDSPLGSATGAAVVFGTTGGVMDAALRSAYFLVTGKNPDPDAFTAVRGMDGWKEATFNIPGAGDVRVAVVSSLGKARKLIEAVKRGDAAYDFVEVMACPGGCAGGGGQPIHDGTELAEDRGNVLWRLDQGELLRFSHENPDVKALYKDYLGAPLGEKSHHLLHTDHNAWQMPQKML